RQTATGALNAVIRNPEYGSFALGTWRVEFKKPALTLVFDDENKLSGTYDAGTDRLALAFQYGWSPLTLTRRTEANAVGFYPRIPRQQLAGNVYRKPIPANDGWEIASLDDVGMDPAPIAALIESLLAADPNEERFLAIHSILISRRGKLVLEEYFRGFGRERPHDMRSAG